MAESDKEKDPEKPPRISIGKPGSADDSPPAEGKGPRRDSTTEEDLLYGETTRINLHDVAPDAAKADESPAGTGESTTRIDLPEEALKQPAGSSPAAKKDTSRIDVRDARPASPGVDASGPQQKAKKDTSRLDAAAARPAEGGTPHDTAPMAPAGGGSVPHDTVPMKPPAQPSVPHDTERTAPGAGAGAHDTERMTPETPGQTARIDLSMTRPHADSGVEDLSDEERERMMKAGTVPMEALEPPAAKKETARVEVEEDAAGLQQHETARMSPATPDTRIPSETAKVTLDKELSPDDVFEPVGLSAPKAAAGDRGVEAPADDADAESGRSKTARIDLPPDALSPKSGRPKTIRIKRADAEPAGKPPTKPPSKEPGKVRGGGRKREPKAPKVKVEAAPGSLGAFSAVLTLGAVIVSLVLLYVLAAQTVLPDLSWFGKVTF